MRRIFPSFLMACVFQMLISPPAKAEGGAESRSFLDLREKMVRTQIEARGIEDERVLAALLKVERHRFVPENMRHYAYTDRALPIGEGQTISQPYIVALMTGLLGLKGGEKVLEIGTGSGYQAAVLAELCGHVYTIEILEPLAKRSRGLLEGLGYKNIEVKCGDGYMGWPEHAPFDSIIVTCAPEGVPEKLVEQLKEGGRMVVPVGSFFQRLELIEKRNGKPVKRVIAPVRFVPMVRGGDTE